MQQMGDAENFMANSMSTNPQGSHSMKKDVRYEDLDQERDELDMDGIDDMEEYLKGVQGSLRDNLGDKTRIKTLEKSLEDEKRRLAGMEMQLREAKRQREAETQMGVVTKQSNMLETMMNAMSKAAHKEMGDRMHWESEWRERFSDFHSQHREMEEALKRKHLQELKTVKEDIQRNIRRVANEVQRTKGKVMPSPRTLQSMQDDNMGRILILFHKHGQERLALASRVAKQEETLVQAKNKSLQAMMGQSQVRSTKLYSKILPAVKAGKQFEIEDDRDGTEATSSAMHQTFRHDDSMSRATTREQSRHSRTRGLGSKQMTSRGGAGTSERANSSWSTRSSAPLPSPRIDYNNITFLTGIESEYEGDVSDGKYTRPSKAAGTGWGKANRSGGSTAGGEQPLPMVAGATNQSDTAGLGSPKNAHLGPKSYFQNPDNAQFAKGIPDPGSYRGGGPLHMQRGENLTNPNVGQEFGEWAPPAPPEAEGRPGWNDGGTMHGFPQQAPTKMLSSQSWHPNIIAFDTSTTGHGRAQSKKFSTASPYLAAQPLSMKAKVASAAGRSSRGGSNASFSGTRDGNSKSGMSKTLPSANTGTKRSKSTEPTRSSGGQGTGRFPKVADSGRQQPTDQNTSRPYTELGKNDDFNLTQNEKIGKLETWIEDKIKGVLGMGASRENILTTKSSVGGRHDLHGQVPHDSDYGNVSTRATTAASVSYPSNHFGQEHNKHDTGVSEAEHEPMARSVSRSGSEAIDGVMSMLKTSTFEDPKVVEAMSRNSGLGIEGRGEKMTRLRDMEASRRGLPIDQVFEGQDIDNSGKFDRDGKRIEMFTSDNIDDRRNDFAMLEDRSKTPKRVGFNVPASQMDGQSNQFGRPGSLSGMSDMMSEVESSRPTSGASDYPASRPDTSASGITDLASTRPGTSASSFIGQGDEEEERVSRLTEKREVGAEEKQQFFSMVRHNKVAEVEDQLNRGFPIDARDAHGNTPLMVAAQNGHKRLCKLTLKFGADSNATNHQGNTSLHFATAYGYSALSKYLISKGADDTLMNMKGLTCYDGIG